MLAGMYRLNGHYLLKCLFDTGAAGVDVWEPTSEPSSPEWDEQPASLSLWTASSPCALFVETRESGRGVGREAGEKGDEL